jgi:hypothetical protein
MSVLAQEADVGRTNRLVRFGPILLQKSVEDD